MPCDNQNNLGGLADMAQATQMAFPLEGWVNTRQDVPATALDRCLCALGPSCAVYTCRQVDLLMIPLPDQKRSGTEISIFQSCDSTFYVSVHVHSILFCLKAWTDSTTTWLSSFYQMIWANHCQLILLLLKKRYKQWKTRVQQYRIGFEKNWLFITHNYQSRRCSTS